MTTVSKFADSWVADPDLHATDGTDAQQLRIHPQGCLYALPLPLQDGSASAVRQAVAAGLPVAGLVPAAVADYLEQQQLYRVHTG